MKIFVDFAWRLIDKCVILAREGPPSRGDPEGGARLAFPRLRSQRRLGRFGNRAPGTTTRMRGARGTLTGGNAGDGRCGTESSNRQVERREASPPIARWASRLASATNPCAARRSAAPHRAANKRFNTRAQNAPRQRGRLCRWQERADRQAVGRQAGAFPAGTAWALRASPCRAILAEQSQPSIRSTQRRLAPRPRRIKGPGRDIPPPAVPHRWDSMNPSAAKL